MISLLFSLWEWRGRRNHNCLRRPEKTCESGVFELGLQRGGRFWQSKGRAFKQTQSGYVYADGAVVGTDDRVTLLNT